MTDTMTEQESDETECARLEAIENLIAHFQEVLTIREYALRFASPDDAEHIDETFNSLLDTILRKLETNVERNGPVSKRVLGKCVDQAFV